MAPPRANTPSRHRPSQAVKANPEPEANTEAESSAPRAKTPYRRRHNLVAETKPEAEIENETRASRAKTPSRRRPTRPIEADAGAENQIESLAQATIPIHPPAPRQWALYFANLVRSPFIPSFCFLCVALTAFHPSPHSHPNITHTSGLGLHNLQQLVRLPSALLSGLCARLWHFNSS